ncbi:DUF6518 family protein, partial [Clavibacter michiganensis]|uniref:DUF6518 family protein n=1 Tax=Clavibacter michiganensis TaxID=28447 RepID=UPI0029317FFD
MRALDSSAGGWRMPACRGVWLSRVRPRLGGVLGAVSFGAMVDAYGVVSLCRGYFLADAFSSMWIQIGMFAGPLIGLASALARHASRRWTVAGVAVASAVLVAAAISCLTLGAETTSPRYWLLELSRAVRSNRAA